MFGALRAGHAYMAVDSARAGARIPVLGGGRRRGAGDGRRGWGGDWTLRVRTPLRRASALLRDGTEVADHARQTLEHRADGPGVYRVEAYREAHGRERTWILSNPIYLR